MRRKLVLPLLAVVSLSACNESMRRFPGPDDMVALVPWFAQMRNHVAIQPYKMPLMPVEGTVPITGREMVPLATPANRALLDQIRNPVQRTGASLERGEDRYAIYCEVCHGANGSGNGPVAPALANTVRNLLEPTQVRNTDGWLYGVIKGGFGLMPEYGSKLSIEDRWNIVNYVRVLQGVGQ